MDGVQIAASCQSVCQQVFSVCDQRVDLLPLFHFGFFAVRRRIRRRVSAEAVGDCVQEYRAVAACQNFLFTGDRIDHRQRIVAVDPLGVHLGWIQACPHADQCPKAHRLPDRLTAHAVEVVDKVDNQRQPAAECFVPKRLELVHGRKAKCFPGRAAACRRISDIADHQARLAVDTLVEGCAHGDIRRAANNRIVRVDPKRRKERMHGAAHAFVEARFAPKDLRQCSVKQKVDGEFFDRSVAIFFDPFQHFAAHVARHDLHQCRVIELLNCRQALRQNVAM